MYSPEESEAAGGSFPWGRGGEEAAFSRIGSQRMQNKLKNVCLDPLILRKKKKGRNQVGGVHVDLNSINAQGASCILVLLAA